MSTRVRFAPSPTGMMHIGGVRTALFNWLFAKQTQGKFILRIEDTDQKRYDSNALTSITNSLKWLGLDWDEGAEVGGEYAPYLQSERKPLYERYAAQMVRDGFAYYCDCSAERLDEVRVQQKLQKLPPGYDGHCRERGLSKADGAGETVIRLKVPPQGKIAFHDEIHGSLSFDLATIVDFVVLKSDGMPTYHLAHVVDDHEMKISHVIRGEEWISSVPKHLLIQQALKIPTPRYVHVPLLLGKDRSKLSKRSGSVAFADFIRTGYLPDAIFNFLALLGWSAGDDVEIMERAEIITKFSVERIQKHPAVFDHDKLRWLNGQHIRKLDANELAKMVRPFLEQPNDDGGLPDEVKRPLDAVHLAAVMGCIQERIEVLQDVAQNMAFFFTDEVDYDPALLLEKGNPAKEITTILGNCLETLSALPAFNAEALEKGLRALADELGLKAGQIFYPLRIAVTGSKIAPPLFETLALIGKQRVSRRINSAILRLEQ